MGVIKVETFDATPTNDGEAIALANDVGSTANAFVKVNSSTDKASGRVGNTGNLGPRDAHMGAMLSGTNQVSFHKGGTLEMRKMGEVWRYTGTPGGLDEFIARGHFVVTLGVGVASNTENIPSLVDRNRAVPFMAGLSSTSTSVNDYDAATVAVFVNGAGQLEVSRQSTGIAVTVYVSVVEFTGANWTIAHAASSNHDTAAETSTLNTDSTGAGGATVDIGNWSNAFIEASMEGDTGETGLSDVLITVEPGATTDSVRFFVQQDGNARNDGTAYAHVIHNAGMIVTRDSDLNFPETNGTVGTVGFPSGTSTTELIDELALEWFADTTGVGTAHARGRLNARITDPTGTIEHWVHRSGNNVSVHWGVIDLSGVQGVAPVLITNSVTQIDPGDTNITITGSNFEAAQGAGNVYISDTAVVGSGTDVIQPIDSWSDTSIQFDADLTGLADGTVYIIVVADGGGSAVWSLNKGIEPYTNTILGMARQPDHYHTFDNTYADEIGGFAANGQNQTGTQGFFADPLTRGRTNSWGVTGTASRIEMVDSPFTNSTNTHRRRFIGGWFRFPSVPLDPKGIWEEGGNVNNIYMVIGFGGKVLFNVADSSNGFKLQAFSDFLLNPNRVYHLGLLFDGDQGCRGFIDGVRQPGFDGLAPNSNQATHIGDFSYGQPDGNLDTGGTDIQYPSFDGSRYNDWATWSNTGNDVPTDADIRVEIFEKGARADTEILSDTPANMQAAIDALTGSSYPDSTMAIRVNRPNGGGNLDLNFDNITFGDRTSVDVQWMGQAGETLTITNRNGSNVTASKNSTAYGGSLSIVNPATLTLTGLQNNTEVRVCEAGTQTEVAGQEDVTTGTFAASVEVPSVDIIIHALGFQHQRLRAVNTSASISLPIQQRVDRQYENA